MINASFADSLTDPHPATDGAVGASHCVAQSPIDAQHEALVDAARQADVIMHGVYPDYTKWDRHLPAHTAQVIDLALLGNALFLLPGNV